MVTKKQFQDQLKKYIFISNEVQEIEGKNVNVEVENVLIGITFQSWKSKRENKKLSTYLSIRLDKFWEFYSDVYPNYQKMFDKNEANNWGHNLLLSYFKDRGVLK